jgi:hypothetical protein
MNIPPHSDGAPIRNADQLGPNLGWQRLQRKIKLHAYAITFCHSFEQRIARRSPYNQGACSHFPAGTSP